MIFTNKKLEKKEEKKKCNDWNKIESIIAIAPRSKFTL